MDEALLGEYLLHIDVTPFWVGGEDQRKRMGEVEGEVYKRGEEALRFLFYFYFYFYFLFIFFISVCIFILKLT